MGLSLQSLVGRRRSRRPRPLPGLAAVFALGLAAGPAPAAALSETILYRFLGGSDGSEPNAGLIVDGEGALYGTTTSGGGSSIYCGGGCGTVFKLTPPQWRETVLYRFKGGLDGAIPEAGLIFDRKGALYGTTAGGGARSSGTVFRLTPPVPPATRWGETILYSFKGGTDGVGPQAGLVFDVKGALYGTTFFGGRLGGGTVFKLTPPVPPAKQWRETVLHGFGAKHDGVNPLGGLVFDAEGVLYGTTDVGNTLHSGHLGTVFKLTPPVPPATRWSETILHGFPATKTDGAQPRAGLTFDRKGALYGTTADGGTSDLGTVFRLDPSSGGEAVLYSFKGVSDGETPQAGVVFDREGALYGTTNGGGVGLGTVFKLDPQSTVDTILHEFTGPPDGQLPAAAVAVGANGVLYGTTSTGGSSHCNCGVVFELH